MTAEVARGARLEYGSTIDVAKTITGITKANPGVATSTAHGYANGDVVMFVSMVGMVELDSVVTRIANITANTFELEGIDTTNMGTFTSGTVRRISAWTTLSDATSVDFGSGSADSIDVSRLLSEVKEQDAGLLSIPDVSVSMYSYHDAAQLAIDAAAYAKTILPFRWTRKSGQRRHFAGIPSTVGESASTNSPITGQMSVVVRSQRYTKYAT